MSVRLCCWGNHSSFGLVCDKGDVLGFQIGYRGQFKAGQHGLQERGRGQAFWVTERGAIVAALKAGFGGAGHEGTFIERGKALPTVFAMPGGDGGLDELPHTGLTLLVGACGQGKPFGENVVARPSRRDAHIDGGSASVSSRIDLGMDE